MNKSKTKNKSLLKTFAAGFALILSTAFFPASAVAFAADFNGETEVNNNTNRIEVGQAGQSTKTKVKKGELVTIPVGEYHGVTSGKIGVIGNSSITIMYKTTGEVVDVIAGKTDAEVEDLNFVADKVGTYVVTYKVVDGGKEYTYDMVVVATASDATFEFTTNDENVLPTVYDTKIADAKDIVLPLPLVNDENGDTIVDGQFKYYTTDKTGAGVTEDQYVYVSVTNGSEAITVKTGDDKLYIDGQELTDDAETLDGQEFKVTYAYYEVRDGRGVYVTSTSKTFTVRDGYYYKDSTKSDAKRGLDLEATWATSIPDSAVVGVAKTLPAINAKTSAENSPASETVNVYYTIQVLKMDGDGKYTIDVTDDTLTDGNVFKAVEEGSYKFVYTISDFYGNHPNTTRSFTIDKVKDTQAAKVYMYDAGDYEVVDNVYTTAEKKLKTQTVTRNVVVYAIAGTDNMVANEDVTVRREVRDASSIKRFVIGVADYQKAYNEYNLIFAPSKADEDSVYKQIVNDNYEIFKQMTIAGEDTTDEEAIRDWLLAHKYLIVTTSYNKDVDGQDIVADATGTADEIKTADIEAMIEEGYAYIPAETTNKNYVFTEQTYNVYYFASDNNNAENSVYYSIKLTGDFTDSSVPTLTFATDLQNVYLPDETVTFNVATATDTVDTAARLDVVTAYRFLAEDKATAVASTTTDKTLRYVIAGQVAAKDTNKWYVTEQDANGLVESEGWYVDGTKTSYSINLANAPANAKYVEVLCYAVDDYGNVGFFNKIIQIADATDGDMPVLYRVVNAPDTHAHIEAPNTIVLPTLQYKDSKAEYMHADVTVYKLAADGTRKVMQNSGMRTSYDTIRGVFTVDAGQFNASTEGTYQVVVTVVDSGNHSVTTYFNYTVVGGVIVEDPEIENVTSESKNLAVDESLYLVPPTVSVTKSDSYGYVGLDAEDDSNTATYYTTTVVSASTSDYELDQYYFTPKAKGTYKLQYNVFLIRYATEALNNGTVKFVDGKLVYVDGTDEYFVYYEKNSEGNYELHFNTDPYLSGAATELEDSKKADAEVVVKGFVLKSNVQTVTVDSVVIKSLTVGDAYQKTQYTTTGEKLEIVKPEVVVSGKGGVNLADSKVTITVTSGSTTRTLATITFDKWEELVASNSDFEVVGNKINLKLDRNGRYTIKYSIQAQDEVGQNVGDAKTLEYTISNGDVVGPEITFEDNFVNAKYALGDELVLNMAGLTVSDKVTTDTDTLLSTMTVKLTNEDTDQSWTLENTAEDGKYSYEHTLNVAGDYTLTITIRDEAGNKTEKSISFTVATESSKAVDAKEVLGGVLIGVSVAILVGVVAYFVVSKVKLDKKEKRYSENKKDKK